MVILKVRLFKGFTRTINANNPAMEGKSGIIRLTLGSRPNTLKSPGLAAIWDKTSWLEADFIARDNISGNAPIVFAIRIIMAIIKTYLQKLFLPANVDSRWFIVT
jgi:hypothetical protein